MIVTIHRWGPPDRPSLTEWTMPKIVDPFKVSVAIIVAIDQYADAALGNRQFFLNKPYGIGGSRNEQTP
jgi:hypothetical protein